VKAFLIVILSLSFALSAYGQDMADSGFNWNDTALKINSSRIMITEYELDGPCTVGPCYNTGLNHFVYDTLIDFLKKNPTIKIEIAFYYNWHLSPENPLRQKRADNMKQTLIDKGINENRLIAKGYGKRKQSIHEKQIDRIITDAMKARKREIGIEVIIRN